MFAKTRSQGTAHEQERSVSPAVVLPSRDSQDAEEEGLLVKAEHLSSGLSGRMPNLSPFHAGVCCLLSVQNSSYVLLRRYSSGVLHEEASAQSILAVGEVLKLCFSWLMILRESPDDPGEARLHDSAKRGPRWFAETSLKLVRTSAKMAVRRALARSRPSARRPTSSLAAARTGWGARAGGCGVPRHASSPPPLPPHRRRRRHCRHCHLRRPSRRRRREPSPSRPLPPPPQVPALIFLGMNLLSFVALERISASSFTLIQQATLPRHFRDTSETLPRHFRDRCHPRASWPGTSPAAPPLPLLPPTPLPSPLAPCMTDARPPVPPCPQAPPTPQTKILFTAVLSRLLLQRLLSLARWRAILTLFLSVLIICHQTQPQAACAPPPRETLATAEHMQQAADMREAVAGEGGGPTERAWHDYVVGVSAVTLEAMLSGLSNVYFERVLKSTALSLWERNVQLAGYSLLIYVPMAQHAHPGDGMPRGCRARGGSAFDHSSLQRRRHAAWLVGGDGGGRVSRRARRDPHRVSTRSRGDCGRSRGDCARGWDQLFSGPGGGWGASPEVTRLLAPRPLGWSSSTATPSSRTSPSPPPSSPRPPSTTLYSTGL